MRTIRHSLSLILFVSFTSVYAESVQDNSKSKVDPDTITWVKDDNVEMNEARLKARQTFPDFMKTFREKHKSDSNFSVKFDLTMGKGNAEWIWAEFIQIKGNTILAKLENKPLLPQYRLGQKVRFDKKYLGDWGYARDGIFQGNFTTRVQLKLMDPAAAESLKNAMGW
jgi:uncharacterized protein YegJ (DUF2314 family)